MPYDYAKQRPSLFTESGIETVMRTFQKMWEAVKARL